MDSTSLSCPVTLDVWHVDKPVIPVGIRGTNSPRLQVVGTAVFFCYFPLHGMAKPSLANKSELDNISTAEQDLPLRIASSPSLSLGNGSVYSDDSQQQQSRAAGILGMAMYPMTP